MCETLAAVFIFDAPFIITWVNFRIRNSLMNNEQLQSYKVPVLGQYFLQLHI